LKIITTIIENFVEFHLGVLNVEIGHGNMSSKLGIEFESNMVTMVISF
jgi:hypothetical protein